MQLPPQIRDPPLYFLLPIKFVFEKLLLHAGDFFSLLLSYSYCRHLSSRSISEPLSPSFQLLQIPSSLDTILK